MQGTISESFDRTPFLLSRMGVHAVPNTKKPLQYNVKYLLRSRMVKEHGNFGLSRSGDKRFCNYDWSGTLPSEGMVLKVCGTAELWWDAALWGCLTNRAVKLIGCEIPEL